MGEFSVYPDAIDGPNQLPKSTDLVTPVKAEVVNRLRDSILQIEGELGVQPSSTFNTVKERLDNMQTQISGISARLTAVEDELGTNPSGTFNTVVARLNDIDSRISALAVSTQIVSPIISGSQDTNSSTFVAKGATIINPTTLGVGSTFTIEVILQTTNATFAASFELFNITEGLVVSHPTITTTSTSATFITVILAVGGADLPADQNNVLEGRVKLASGAGASDRAVCKYAAVRTTPV